MGPRTAEVSADGQLAYTVGYERFTAVSRLRVELDDVRARYRERHFDIVRHGEAALLAVLDLPADLVAESPARRAVELAEVRAASLSTTVPFGSPRDLNTRSVHGRGLTGTVISSTRSAEPESSPQPVAASRRPMRERNSPSNPHR